jgi:membrane fusion protein, multidrug efflux system
MIQEQSHKMPNQIPPDTEKAITDGPEVMPIPPRSPRRALPVRAMGLGFVGLLLLGGIGYGVVSHQNSQGQANGGAKSGKSGRNGKDQVTPVSVATVTQKSVPLQITAIGNVQAGAKVAVTPQASGRITSVLFQKGEEVHKGQLLFTLDDRSQVASMQQVRGGLAKDQAQVQQARAVLAKDLGLVEQARANLTRDRGLVRQAEAALAKDEAQAGFAQSQSDRYDKLYKQGAISQDQAQQYSASSKVSAATLQVDREAIENAKVVLQSDEIAIQNAEAVVQGDKAAIENAEAVVSGDSGVLGNAEVQSSYAKIYAPIDGRAGNVLVTEGNVVQANSNNPLVVIQKIRPIQVAFSVPEANLPELQKRMDNGRLKVEVNFAGNADHPISGTLSFLNNTVDNATGTIQLIGDFDNSDGKLFPGQFVNTTLTLAQLPNAIVVPTQAVQNGPNGQFVFLVKPDDTVENVPVVISNTIEGLAVVQKGVNPGDQVVIDGQANLSTGSKIRLKGSGGGDSGADKATGDDHAKPTASPTANPTASPDPNAPATPKKGRGKKRGAGNQAGGNP